MLIRKQAKSISYSVSTLFFFNIFVFLILSVNKYYTGVYYHFNCNTPNIQFPFQCPRGLNKYNQVIFLQLTEMSWS